MEKKKAKFKIMKHQTDLFFQDIDLYVQIEGCRGKIETLIHISMRRIKAPFHSLGNEN